MHSVRYDAAHTAAVLMIPTFYITFLFLVFYVAYFPNGCWMEVYCFCNVLLLLLLNEVLTA